MRRAKYLNVKKQKKREAMKKILVFILMIATFLLSSCDGFTVPGIGGGNDTGGGNSGTGDGGFINNGDAIYDTDKHKDADGNGACDDCNESVIATFDLYNLNDLHGKVSESTTQPGIDELTSYLKGAINKNQNTVLLSTGDMWQGGSESNLTRGLIITDWMNELGFSSLTLGNHEFDWGSDAIKENGAAAEFPILAINIYDRETNLPVDYCQGSVMINKNGIKIGVIGAIGDCYSSISADKVQDVYFKVGSDLTALVKAESEKLRAEGADMIIYTLHDGYGKSTSSETKVSDYQISSYYDVSLSRGGFVDLVFEGHSHRSYVLKDTAGVYHLQGGGDNDGISHTRVNINFAANTSTLVSADIVKNEDYKILSPDNLIGELLAKYEDVLKKANEKLGINSFFRTGNEMRQKIAELYYEAALERWGEEYDIALGGGYLSVRSPGNLVAGEVIYADLQMLFPFDNPLTLCSVDGYTLKEKFFESTNSDYFIAYGDYGAELRNNIDTYATYYIVVDTYSAYYAPNDLTIVDFYDQTTYARDLLADFIKEGGYTAKAEYTLTSIPDALAIGNALTNGSETEEYYYLAGTVTNIVNTEYGNLTLVDESGNSIYVYGVRDATNTVRYDALENPPKEGDYVVFRSTIKKYVSQGGAITVELIYAQLIEHTPAE